MEPSQRFFQWLSSLAVLCEGSEQRKQSAQLWKLNPALMVLCSHFKKKFKKKRVQEISSAGTITFMEQYLWFKGSISLCRAFWALIWW